jgi:DNA-binding LacI/PurR family transcriptional regulator
MDKETHRPVTKHSRSGILDVAHAAGVSPSTVSRVLNGTAAVSPEPRKAVEKAIRELNFEPNRFARSLVTNHSAIIGILLDRSVKYATANIMVQLEEVASSLGYMSVVLTIDKPFRRGLSKALAQFQSIAVEGITVVAPRVGLSEELSRCDVKVPVMILSSQLRDIGIPMIGEDQYKGAYKATQYLVDAGHRSIWHVAGSMDWFDELRRREGWHDALKEKGLIEGSRLIQCTWSTRSAYETMMEADLSELPDAIFVASDHMAAAIISALNSWGCQVPRDVSIIGYDDAEATAYMHPPLTTVQQNLSSVARRAMALLIKQIHQETIPMLTVMQPKLIIRKSVSDA